MRIFRIARKKDSNGKPISLGAFYVLKKKLHGMNDPYFYGGGSLFSPQMAMDFDDAFAVQGTQLENMALDWTRDWVAIEIRDIESYGPSDIHKPSDIDQSEPLDFKTIDWKNSQ